MNYLEWGEQHLRHQDIFRKEIVSTKKVPLGIEIQKKAGVELIVGVGVAAIPSIPSGYTKVWLILDNSSSRVKDVVAAWSELSANQVVRILFVDLKQNKYWAVHPYTHAKISAPNKILEGLMSLYTNC